MKTARKLKKFYLDYVQITDFDHKIPNAGEPQRINTNIMAFGLGPGFTIFSSSAVGIEALVKYNFARSRFDTDIAGLQRETVTRTNQFDFSIGFQFYLGGFEVARPSGNRLY